MSGAARREPAVRRAPWQWTRVTSGLASGLASGLLLAGIAWPVAAVAPPALSFAEAQALLRERNEQLAAERAVFGQAEAERDAAMARRWPELGLSAWHVRMEEPVAIDVAPLAQQLPPGLLPDRLELQPRHFTTAAATLRWPLYSGGRISAGIEAGEAALAAGRAGLEGAEAGLTLRLVERYFAQVLAEHALRVKAASAETLADHLGRARRLEAHGQIARAEVLRAEVALAEARVEAASARQQATLAAAALATLLASDHPYQTRTPMPEPPPLPPLAPLLATAEADNPSLRAARQQQRRAEAGARAAAGERLPGVALIGQHALYRHNLDLLASDWVLGVAVSWSLFDGGRLRSQQLAARLRADEVAQRLAAGRRDIGLLIRQRHSALADALARLDAFTAMQQLAAESLRAQRRAFEEGLASSLNVVDAELAVQRVELGRMAARYDGLLAAAGLHEAAGRAAGLGELIEQGVGHDQH